MWGRGYSTSPPLQTKISLLEIRSKDIPKKFLTKMPFVDIERGVFSITGRAELGDGDKLLIGS